MPCPRAFVKAERTVNNSCKKILFQTAWLCSISCWTVQSAFSARKNISILLSNNTPLRAIESTKCDINWSFKEQCTCLSCLCIRNRPISSHCAVKYWVVSPLLRSRVILLSSNHHSRGKETIDAQVIPLGASDQGHNILSYYHINSPYIHLSSYISAKTIIQLNWFIRQQNMNQWQHF